MLSRLFFGAHLQGQFELLLAKADEKGIDTIVKTNCTVDDVINKADLNEVWVLAEQSILSLIKLSYLSGIINH